MTQSPPYARATEAAARLARLTGADKHQVGLVLGSGWLPAVDALGRTVAELATTDLPGFAAPGVEGHAGRVRSVEIGGTGGSGRRALVFVGRTHLYEGHGVEPVVHGVRTAVAAGCETIVLTNGCGGLDPAWSPGTAVLISDHINLTATSPLTGPRFVDLTDLYSRRLREVAHEVEPDLVEGVYVQFPGPHYETPAEIAMVRAMGGTLVGMSTALEAIASREMGAEVLGLSLVTNHAAGVDDRPLDHDGVLATGQASAHRMGGLLGRLLPRL